MVPDGLSQQVLHRQGGVRPWWVEVRPTNPGLTPSSLATPRTCSPERSAPGDEAAPGAPPQPGRACRRTRGSACAVGLVTVSRGFAKAWKALGLTHMRTGRSSPRTHGRPGRQRCGPQSERNGVRPPRSPVASSAGWDSVPGNHFEVQAPRRLWHPARRAGPGTHGLPTVPQ